jgi:hypothetical protein
MAGQSMVRYGAARTGAAFVAGVVTGLFLREAVQRAQGRARRKWAHAERERTVAFGENLPESLERREPAPHEGQTRYGGTGALGVSPAAIVTEDR